MRVCVYCSSSDAVPQVYVRAARKLGELIGTRGHSLVFGGGAVGLMGVLAEGAHRSGARVTGVMPRAFEGRGISSPHVEEMIVTADMRERKAAMAERADAFIALPGGFGTLEELLESITLKQLGYHSKAVALLDTGGFYSPLLEQFERLYALSFAKAAYRRLYHVAADPEGALEYVESYRPSPLVSKWF